MSSSGMTDLEIHAALLAAVTRAPDLSADARTGVLDEVNRHRPGCKAAPWRDCPVITHYARVYEVDLNAVLPRARVGAGRAQRAK